MKLFRVSKPCTVQSTAGINYRTFVAVNKQASVQTESVSADIQPDVQRVRNSAADNVIDTISVSASFNRIFFWTICDLPKMNCVTPVKIIR